MSSVSLSASVRSNLLTLKSTADELETTTERLSSGKKVASAVDNPTNYFAALNYNDKADALDSRLDSMGEATQMINAADNGITSIKSFLSQMEGVVNDALANTDSDERNDLGEQFNSLLVQIRDMAKDSGYGGINLLYDNASTTVQFGENIGDSTLTLEGFNISAAAGDLNATTGEIDSAAGYIDSDGSISSGSSAGATGYALTLDAGGNDAVGIKSAGTSGDDWEINWGGTGYLDDLEDVIGQIEDMDSSLQTQSSKLANNLAVITQREDFTEEAINILEEGADNLTLADLNEEGANLLSLQTSESLAVQSLSLASSSASNVLQLIS